MMSLPCCEPIYILHIIEQALMRVNSVRRLCAALINQVALRGKKQKTITRIETTVRRQVVNSPALSEEVSA